MCRGCGDLYPIGKMLMNFVCNTKVRVAGLGKIIVQQTTIVAVDSNFGVVLILLFLRSHVLDSHSPHITMTLLFISRLVEPLFWHMHIFWLNFSLMFGPSYCVYMYDTHAYLPHTHTCMLLVVNSSSTSKCYTDLSWALSPPAWTCASVSCLWSV